MCNLHKMKLLLFFSFILICSYVDSGYGKYLKKSMKHLQSSETSSKISSLTYRKTLKKKKTINKSNKIVGGTVISIQKVPYHVAIVKKRKRIPSCGGAIITKKHVITAAHCVDSDKKYFIFAGSSAIGRGTRIDVHKVKNYENGTGLQGDISVLTLEKPLKYSRRIKKIALPKQNEKYKVGEMALVVGFGDRDEEGTMATKLRAAEVPTLNLSKCKKLIKYYDPGTLCAGYDSGRKDACFGDSGGPLVQNNKLLGVVSYGNGCARANNPGVYTDVAKYIDFIKSETQNLRD